MSLISSSSLPTAAGLLGRAGFVQDRRLLVLHTPLGTDRLLAERLEGEERIDGGGFRFTLTALSDDAHIPLKDLIGQGVRIDVQAADGSLRAFHGQVTRFELAASNGGFARYRLCVEPWLAFLRWREDSFLFQDMSVFDIVDSVFGDYAGAGALDPQWRWDVADRSIYPRRGITTQFQETDLAFVDRLLAEEGLYYWFEHEGGGQGAEGGLGKHTMVIADHPGAFQPNRQGTVAYHRADVTETEDSLQQWRARRQLQTNALKRQSWDYKSVAPRPLELASDQQNSAQRFDLTWADDPGVYAWEDSAQGERLLANALQGLEVRNKLFEGESTVRTLSPATTFVLDGHFAHEQDSEDDRRFAVLAITHAARNNFDEDMQRAVDEALGDAADELEGSLLQASSTPDGGLLAKAGNLLASVADKVGSVAGQLAAITRERANAEDSVPFYRNRFTAVRARIPYRPLTLDGHGVRVHPKPTVFGSQSAVVIGGSDGGPVHTDRDHRIKVQFHWQRGAGGSARQSHPAGENNAPAVGQLGAWLRVAAAAAGDNWGQVAVPRVGQEVLVDYLNGDIDRPVVVASLYNGAGAEDAQHNDKQAGAAGATGNAPAWFPGQSGEHQHPSIFSGIKTQELSGSQSGSGGYNQLVFDDTPGQSRLNLSTTLSSTRLSLGHHVHQTDNQRGGGRGYGAELASAAHGALRGGSGLLISADAQPGASASFMDSTPALAQTQQALQLAQALAGAAAALNAKVEDEPEAAELPAMKGLADVAEALGATQQGLTTEGESGGKEIKATQGGDGTVSAYAQPLLEISAPKGIGLVTPREAVFVSGTTTTIVSAQDVDLAAQRQISVAVAEGLVLSTGGATASGGEPNQERGIRMHAATGAVTVRALSSASTLSAQQTVTIASTTQDVAVEGKEHLLATAGGGYIKLVGSDVLIHAPGAVTFRASAHRFVGPAAASVSRPLPTSALAGCVVQAGAAAAMGGGLLKLGATQAAEGGGAGTVARQAATAAEKEAWAVDDVLKIMCPQDKETVDGLAQTDVTVVDRVYFDDPYYDGTRWTTQRFEAGGTAGNGITVMSGTSAGTAATTLYHENLHMHQPEAMSWTDKEIDAYARTEAWTIERGLPSQAGNEPITMRKPGAGGKEVVDMDGVRDFVREHYPISQEGPAAAGKPPVVVVDKDATGNVILSDGSTRAPRKGDTFPGPEIRVGERKIPRDAWKCPEN